MELKEGEYIGIVKSINTDTIMIEIPMVGNYTTKSTDIGWARTKLDSYLKAFGIICEDSVDIKTVSAIAGMFLNTPLWILCSKPVMGGDGRIDVMGFNKL